MGTSSPGLSVPRDPPVWCEAEAEAAANITPELPAERRIFSKHGRRRAVINPRPRMVGAEWPLRAATRVVPQRFFHRLCLLAGGKGDFLSLAKIPAEFSAKGLAVRGRQTQRGFFCFVFNFVCKILIYGGTSWSTKAH